MSSTFCCACAALAIAIGTITNSPAALGQGERVPRLDFQLVLQTSGDWSGNFTGETIGFSDYTIILYQHEAGEVPLEGPEFVDMEAHLAMLTSAIEEKVPEEYDGLAILDYEAWPLSLYNVNWPQIRDPRIQRQLDLHPEMSYNEAERRAANLYLGYVQDFFLRSLQTAKTMRPKATWGFYSLVCEDRWLPADEYRRWVNDQSNWLWDEVDAICPHGYIGLYEGEPGHNTVERLVADKTAEAVRLAQNVENRRGVKPLVLTYVNPRVVMWGLSRHEGEWLEQPQLHTIFGAVWVGGGDGLILWQAVSWGNKYRPTEPEYIEILNSRVRTTVEELGFRVFAGQNTDGLRP